MSYHKKSKQVTLTYKTVKVIKSVPLSESEIGYEI